ncbi:MAG TPA: ABC transporter substrate-binding protein [Solirubrobacteraceae bacterium]|nr:ABC transporter substrate-binding protein [Solirubrobacteraceae bacterium]
MGSNHTVPRVRLGLVSVAAVVLLALAGCGGSAGSSSAGGGGAAGSSSAAASSGGGGGGTSSVSTSSCGPKPGVRATGTPINLGTINTKQPGTDFTDQANMAQAYLTCVNANGGVNGHPVKLFIETDQTQPAQIAAAAKLLVQSDHVLGIVGTSDIIECSVNHAYWAGLGIYELGAGIDPECWSTANSASVNMGPRYSSDGATQYVLSLHPSKVVFDQSNVPGTGYIAGGPTAVATAAHVPIRTETDNVPLTDANSVALRLVDDAGSGGVVVLNFTPPEALIILEAAQKLGLENRVKAWACSTPCNTDFLAKALGPKWSHKFFVNAELTPPDASHGQEMQLYEAILKKYGSAVTGGIGSFSQMGFLDAEMAVSALEKVKGAYTVKSVNAALKGITNYKTEMLCKPFTYGNYSEHIPNNTDYTVTPSGAGTMVVQQGCTAISGADPQIAAYRKIAGS